MMIKPKQIKAKSIKTISEPTGPTQKYPDLMQNQIQNYRKSNPHFVNDWY